MDLNPFGDKGLTLQQAFFNIYKLIAYHHDVGPIAGFHEENLMSLVKERWKTSAIQQWKEELKGQHRTILPGDLALKVYISALYFPKIGIRNATPAPSIGKKWN